MLIPIAAGATFEFSSKSDPGEPKTIFKLAYLDPYLFAYLRDSTVQMQSDPLDAFTPTGVVMKASQLAYLRVKYALRGWKNFMDGSGIEIPCIIEKHEVPGIGMRECVSDASLALLSFATIEELAGAVVASNRLSEGERKN